MKIAFFSTKPYDREFFSADELAGQHEFQFFVPRLMEETLPLAKGYPCICVFVNDVLDRPTIEALAADGLKLIALRCAGFNNVDLEAARENGVTVVRVPAYSPHAVAEHTVGLMLALNRSLHRAYNRVRSSADVPECDRYRTPSFLHGRRTQANRQHDTGQRLRIRTEQRLQQQS